MELIDPSWKKWQLLSSYLRCLLVVLATGLSTAQLISLAWSSQQVQQSLFAAPLPQCDHSKIGSGAMGFLPQKLSILGEVLGQEILVVGKNARPGSECQVALALKSTGERKEAICGEKIFLSADKVGYRFGEGRGDVVIVPQSGEGDEVIFAIEPTAERLALKPSWLFRQSIEEEPYVQALRKAKLWGSDQLFCSFGGGEYHSLGLQHKIEMGKSVYFLNEGETLWWDGMSWMQGYKNGAPLVKFLSSSSQGVQMEVWDGSGYEHAKIEILLHTSLAPTLKPSEMMASVKVRAGNEISCQLGKRRVLVHEGDWWIKAGQRWRPVRTTRDLEAVLHHEIQGELVMFDKIEAAGGKVMVKGRYFDRMRTQSQPLALTLSTEKKASTPQQKHGSAHVKVAGKAKTSPPQLGQRNDEE
jgi:hypothetical protein